MNQSLGVIILAGGDIKNKFSYLKNSCFTPSLIPINTRPIGSYVLEFYQKTSTRNIFLVVDEAVEPVIRQELHAFLPGVTVVSIPQTNGVVESLKVALKKIPVFEEYIINLVTTIPTRFPNQNEIQLSKVQKISKEWSGIQITENDNINFVFKKEQKNKVKSYAFTGIFRTNQCHLEKALQLKLEVKDLLSIIKNISIQTQLDYFFVDWLDVGHEINYYEAKLKLIESRAFNNIRFQTQKGLLSKVSSKVQKLEQEVNFIKMIPKDLSVFFPRIISSGNYGEELAHYEMEYYGYPNIAELLLYWDLSQGIWERIFLQFQNVFENFSTHKYSIGKKAFLGFYETKLIDRVSLFEKQLVHLEPIEKSWLHDDIIINGNKCLSFYKLISQIKKYIHKLYNENDFCIMHGDFCFNNILYDVSSSVLRMIDPRGSFGSSCIGIYGDQKYDLAKIAHSSIGGYDYLVNHLFKLEEEKHQKEFYLNFNLRSNQEWLETHTENLIQNLGYKTEDIQFIMGLLFVSMTPLHNDSYLKQKAMFIHGLNILNRVLS